MTLTKVADLAGPGISTYEEVEAVLRLALERETAPIGAFRHARGICLRHMRHDDEADRHPHDAHRDEADRQELIRASLVGTSGGCERLHPDEQANLDLATGNFRKQLGRYLRMVGRYREAEEELLDARSILSAVAGASHHLTLQASEELVALYEDWDAE